MGKLFGPIYVVLALAMAKASSSSSPVPLNHLREAFREIRNIRLLPPHSVVLDSMPSIQVSSFKVDDYKGSGLNLQSLLGFDVPSDVIYKLENRVQAIRY